MIRIHPTAEVSPAAEIGDSTSIWHYVQIREGARIGSECIIGKNVYVGFGVQIGNRVKIQNNCSVYHGAELEDGVFLGPHVVLTNDTYPRAINPDGTLPAHGLVVGNPARLIGYVCACGRRLAPAGGDLACTACGATYADPPPA